MPLLWLVLDWRRRLAALLAHGERPDGADDWLAPGRIRILAFLIARYAPLAESPAPPMIPTPLPASQPFCAVEHPSGPPPRPSDVIRALLLQIHDCNSTPRRRWWWF